MSTGSMDNEITQIIPYLEEVERSVLGAIIADRSVYFEVASNLSAGLFYKPLHAEIYEKIEILNNQGKVPDTITLAKSFIGSDFFATVGESSKYFVGLITGVGLATQISEHIFILKEYQIKREILTKTKEIQTLIYLNEDVSDVHASLNNLADSVNNIITNGSRGLRHIKEISKKAVTEARERREAFRKGKSPGIPTGIAAIDAICNGWQGSQLIIIAGRPAMGKTSLLLKFMKSAAMSNYHACAYSLEMSDVRLADRMLLSACDVNSNAFRAGVLTDSDFQKLEDAEREISKMPIHIDDNASVSMRYIRAHSIAAHRRGKCDIVFIDYLQLCNSATEKNANRERQVAETSRLAKQLAKELNIPVVLLSQLNREVENTDSKCPQLSHLRESGAIEQDADIVAFIFRPEYYKQKQMFADEYGTIDTDGVGVFVVAKHRDGPIRNAVFSYNQSLTQITDYVPKIVPQFEANGRPVSEGSMHAMPMETVEDDFNKLPF